MSTVEMDRVFMRRSSAVAYLLDRRRMLFERIAAAPSGDVELESQQVELLDRLVLDVRVGRVRSFELAHPKAFAVLITD
jgi:hypothetical protein